MVLNFKTDNVSSKAKLGFSKYSSVTSTGQRKYIFFLLRREREAALIKHDYEIVETFHCFSLLFSYEKGYL